jgi:RHS repeat-associated protein
MKQLIGLRSFMHDGAGRLSQIKAGAGRSAPQTAYLYDALGQRRFKSEVFYGGGDGDGREGRDGRDGREGRDGGGGDKDRDTERHNNRDRDLDLGTAFSAWLKKHFGHLFNVDEAARAKKTGIHYVYDEGRNLVGEYGDGGASSAASKEYIWLPTASGPLLVGMLSKGKLYAIHTDHLGSPRLVTDSANKPVWQWAYSALGDNAPQVLVHGGAGGSSGSGSGGGNSGTGGSNTGHSAQASHEHDAHCEHEGHDEHVVLNLRFPGQYFDKESTLHYNGYRYYQPTTGRYVQADPIGLGGGENRFAYVNDNAINGSDPRGLCMACLIPLIRVIPVVCSFSQSCQQIFDPNSYQTKTPNTGNPGEWHTNPGSGQERLYGPNRKPEVDIDWDHNHGQGQPHPHNWGPDGARDVPENGFSPWPRGRTSPAQCAR